MTLRAEKSDSRLYRPSVNDGEPWSYALSFWHAMDVLRQRLSARLEWEVNTVGGKYDSRRLVLRPIKYRPLEDCSVELEALTTVSDSFVGG